MLFYDNMNFTHLCLGDPAYLNVPVNCNSNQSPDTVDDKEVEDRVTNVRMKYSKLVCCLDCWEQDNQAVSQEHKYQDTHIIDRLGY